MSQPPTISTELSWLLEEWGSGLAVAIEMMGADRPTVSEGNAASEVSQDAETRCGLFDLNLVDGPSLAIEAPGSTWKTISTQVLTAIGMEATNQQVLLETYQEIIGQAVSHLAQSVSARLGKEVLFTASEQLVSPLDSDPACAVEVSFGPEARVKLYVRVATTLLTALAPSVSASAPSAAVPDLGTLGDMEMNVTVSLGTARLTLAEALTLGPGSIVQLDSLLDDLVVVKVDEKILAQGEVVAVDNSYAIRITRLASTALRT